MAEVNEIRKVLDGRYEITQRPTKGIFGQTFLVEGLKRPNNPYARLKNYS